MDTVNERSGKLSAEEFDTGVKKFMYSNNDIIEKRKDFVNKMEQLYKGYAE
jgi:hypothetical protein